MKDKSYYSAFGRMFKAFLCLLFVCGFAVSLSLCLTGFEKFGSAILLGNQKNYEETEQYRSEMSESLQQMLSVLSATIEGASEKISLVDVSEGKLYEYDVPKMYEDEYNTGLCSNIETLEDYRINYTPLYGCNLRDYDAAREFFAQDMVKNSYVYLDAAAFRALFIDNGLQNVGCRFSDSFPEDSYFLFDFTEKNKKSQKTLDAIRDLYEKAEETESVVGVEVRKTQENPERFDIENVWEEELIEATTYEELVEEHPIEASTQYAATDALRGSYDLTDITFAVYIPEENIYYSTRDEYFDQYQTYVYSAAQVNNLLNEMDRDRTRYNSILLPLLLSENMYDTWLDETYINYGQNVEARRELENNHTVAECGEIYYFSGGKTVETNFPETALSDAENFLKGASTATVKAYLRSEEGEGAIRTWMDNNDYRYYSFRVQPDGSAEQMSNGDILEDEYLVTSLYDCAVDAPVTLIYGYYVGDKKLENSHWQRLFADYSFYRSNIKYLLAAALLSGLLALLLAIRLIAITGRRFKKDSEVSLIFYDRLPFEVWVIVSGFIEMVCFGIVEAAFLEINDDPSKEMLALIMVPSSLLLAFPALLLLLSFARRIKAHNIWNHTFCYWAVCRIREISAKSEKDGSNRFRDKLRRGLRILREFFARMLSDIKRAFGRLKGTSRLLLVALVFAFCNFALTALIIYKGGLYEEEMLLASGGLQLLGLVGVLMLIREMNRVNEGVSELVKGNLDHKIEVRTGFGIYREFTDNINHIGDGLKTAVETSLKDERMKTELITNVSHDLKTPLTSIINYINLLKTEKMPTAEAEHYVEVLDNKAQRLRQLTEDLVEAAKATSGNIELEMLPITFDELMRQAVGEFEDKFVSRELTLVTEYPKEPLKILADGRRIYRVLENVLQNVYKYAMQGTRVYIDLQGESGTVILTVKNVSAAPLNISPEELMERFTRGDASRTTEGSGLGLSIAKDLTALMGGSFDIILDGDLFKVVIIFPELTYQRQGGHYENWIDADGYRMGEQGKEYGESDPTSANGERAGD